MSSQHLWLSSDPNEWQAVLDDYWKIIDSIGKDKLAELERYTAVSRLDAISPSRRHSHTLLHTHTANRWYQDDLPPTLQSTNHITHPQLVRLVTWKVGQRGKFRPRLLNFAQTLDAIDVEDVSTQAFKALKSTTSPSSTTSTTHYSTPESIKAALQRLCALKGIGPATASAVLSAYDPSIAFTSDEAMMAVMGSKDYTVKAVVELTEAARKKAAALSAAQGSLGRSQPSGVWTARKIEQCLFAHAQMQKNADLTKGGKTKGKKRKR